MNDSLSRREFNRRLAGATAGAAMLGAGVAPAAIAGTAEPRVLPEGEYVDFHTHLGQEWGNRPPLTADGLLRWMDDNDVAQAVVHPLENPEAWDHPITTNYVLEQTAPHRDRLIPAAAIDPRIVSINLTMGRESEATDLLNRFIDEGARVFGEHKPGIAIDDPRNIRLFESAAEAGLAILFHMDSRRNMDEVGLPGLERVLQAVPDGVFVGHAQGFWAAISGDMTEDDFQAYPESEVAPGGALDRLMSEYPNLYGDLGAGSGANAIARDIEFGREFIIRNADQLVWSSDYLAPGNNVRQLELYPRLDLPEEVQQKVFRDNSRRLVGLL